MVPSRNLVFAPGAQIRINTVFGTEVLLVVTRKFELSKVLINEIVEDLSKYKFTMPYPAIIQ